VRVEFTRDGNGDEVVATARWDGRHAVVPSSDPEIRAALQRVFRPTPVVVDDPSLRSLGARGESVIQPGSLEWFRVAAFTRGPAEGLGVRIVPEVAGQGGWDPAAAYRTFPDAVEQLVLSAESTRPEQQPGEEADGAEERSETGDQPRDSDAPHTVK
jgi:hypothetical protein